MRKFPGYISLILLLHLSVLCQAQNEEYMPDTLVMQPPPEAAKKTTSSFSTISQTKPVFVRKVSREKIEELKSDEAYWYANLEPEKKKKEQVNQDPPKRGLMDAGWFRNLLWMIILGSFIGVVIWYLASSNINLFRKEPKKIIDENAEDEIADDIFSINYDHEIQKAVAANNFRLAVRLWYLKTLKELADRNIIDYRHEKTDSDYVNSLFGGRYYKDFFRLTRNFEYTWYGQFHLSPDAYEMMRKDFANFQNSLN